MSILRVFWLAFFFLCSSVYAAIPPSNSWYAYRPSYGAGQSGFATSSAACQWAVYNWRTVNNPSIVYTGTTQYSTVAQCLDSAGLNNLEARLDTVNKVCPANSTLSGTSCTCNTGYVEQNGSCVVYVDPCDYLKGTTNNNFSVVASGGSCGSGSYNIGVSGLNGSCQGTFTPSTSVSMNGTTYCVGKIVYTGVSQTASTTFTPTEAQQKASPTGATTSANDADAKKYAENLASGKCPGTVNGVQVWVTCGTVKTTSTTTTTNKDASGNVTSTGTSTATKETSCSGGTCTTSTTTTNPDGTQTVVSGSSSQAKFCEENPTATICKNSNFTPGTCTGAAPMCEGDAVQCAMAKKQHESYCQVQKMVDPDPDANNVYKQAVSGADGKSIEKMKEATQQVSVQNFDQTGLGLSRSCPADPSFSIHGASFSIPFSKACGLLNAMAMVAVGITLLGSLTWTVKPRG